MPGLRRTPRRAKGRGTLLGIVAAILFFIAFLINATSAATSAIFSPTSLMLLGLACLALHLTGVGTGWSVTRRRR